MFYIDRRSSVTEILVSALQIFHVGYETLSGTYLSVHLMEHAFEEFSVKFAHFLKI